MTNHSVSPVEKEIIHKSGAFYSYQEQRLAQGRDNARKYLKEHPELTAEIDKKVREILFAEDAPAAPSEVENETAETKTQEEEDDLALLEEDLGEDI